jgi:magnesium transporter
MDVLDTMGTRVEEIDKQLMKKLKRDTLESIYDMKRDMLYLRSIISPLKEIILKLQKEDDTQIMQESTVIYLKDLFDHVIQVNDSIDTYREMLASFIDFYMMINSNKMNQIVKTLTIISTIFIPLTFITGIYGMVIFTYLKNKIKFFRCCRIFIICLNLHLNMDILLFLV